MCEDLGELFVEKLIECVEEHPQLYDKNHQSYYSKSNRNQVWQNISIELGIECEDLQKKWKLLREKYVKELKKQERPSKTGSCNVDWQFLKQMEFLKEFISPKRKYSETREISESYNTDYSQRDDDTRNRFEIVDVVVDKREKEESFDTALQAFTTTANLLQSNLESMQTERSSVEARFANLVEASLNELQDDGKDEAMEKIFSILMEVKKKYKRKYFKK